MARSTYTLQKDHQIHRPRKICIDFPQIKISNSIIIQQLKDDRWKGIVTSPRKKLLSQNPLTPQRVSVRVELRANGGKLHKARVEHFHSRAVELKWDII